jgi:hypothetical protein
MIFLNTSLVYGHIILNGITPEENNAQSFGDQ